MIECHVAANPHAQIWWKKNNKRLSDTNRKFRVSSSLNASYLRVSEASQLSSSVHSLSLTCVAENVHGMSEATARLHIVPAKQQKQTLLNRHDTNLNFPQVRITPPRSVEPDTSFRIECNSTNSNENLFWYQSNRPVILFDGGEIQQQQYVANFTKLDQNTYRHFLYVLRGLSLPLAESIEVDFMCVARNEQGRTSAAETSIMLRSEFFFCWFFAFCLLPRRRFALV